MDFANIFFFQEINVNSHRLAEFVDLSPSKCPLTSYFIESIKPKPLNFEI